MAKYMNEANLPLSIAAYLACDFYDHIPDAISATALLKPTRQLVLAKRVPAEMATVDVGNMLASRMGTAIHDGIEKVWLNGHYKDGLLSLGYPQQLIDRIVINPDPDDLPENSIPVYMEQRLFREVNGHTISGKFDFIGEGRLEDFKSTSVYTWLYQSKTEDYKMQGSIYRWLDQGKRIKEDHMQITYIFKDWSAAKAQQDQKYPRSNVLGQTIPLMDISDTEAFIQQKLTELDRMRSSHEQDLPLCTDKDLWRDPPKFKYYKNGNVNASRSTANFDSMAEAVMRQQQDGGVGAIVEVPGKVKACKWCPAFPVCGQKDRYLEDGSLSI